jgi:hypothetical protein
MKTQAEPRDVLAQLRQTLWRLDRTGDLTSPSIADLRRIISKRIAELEVAAQEASATQGTVNVDSKSSTSETPYPRLSKA